MKCFIKGIVLGISLVLTNKICCLFEHSSFFVFITFATSLYFVVITSFLISKSIEELLVCGFAGLVAMFTGEIFYIIQIQFHPVALFAYIIGLLASIPAIITSAVLTIKKIRLSDLIYKEISMNSQINLNLKLKLIIYFAISAITFSYLVTPEDSAIGVISFFMIQLIYLFFTIPDKKKLIYFIPVILLAANCFISGSEIFRISNMIIIAAMYSCMLFNLNFKSDSFVWLFNIIKNLISPFRFFALPFKWLIEMNAEKAPVIKKIIIAVIIAIPTAIILIAVLSNADTIFSIKANNLFEEVFSSFNANTYLKTASGIIAGLYLFGMITSAFLRREEDIHKDFNLKGDLIIVNILLSTILFIYTLFVVVQFKYLFAGSALPQGLSYTEYARKGFFELLALSFINIVILLIVVKLFKNNVSKWNILTKILCHYLCSVTLVLLISSFLRMVLYTNDDGLTRLRLFVMGFLVFETIGLIFTFIYISKPKFNITLIYAVLALSYYIILNLIPVDYIIAKNQINKYLSREREDIDYVFTLSSDAAPAMEYLIKNTDDESIIAEAKKFIFRNCKSHIPKRWQRFNLSKFNAEKIYYRLK